MGHSKTEITLNLYGHLLKETLTDAAQKTEKTVFNCPASVPSEKKGVSGNA